MMSISQKHHHIKSNNHVNNNDSLLTNSFDEQIKLVGESITTIMGDNPKEKKKNKTSNKATLQETENAQKQYGKNVYSHRSRIFRFDSNNQEHVAMIPPINVDMVIDPPKDETDARASMLMSWYMAGYRTGYYEAMKRCAP